MRAVSSHQQTNNRKKNTMEDEARYDNTTPDANEEATAVKEGNISTTYIGRWETTEKGERVFKVLDAFPLDNKTLTAKIRALAPGRYTVLNGREKHVNIDEHVQRKVTYA